MGDFSQIIARIRERWPLVLAVGVVGMLVAAFSAATSGSSATAQATVVVGGSGEFNRTPDQDSALARGYVELIGSPQYQDRLRTEGEVPPDVAISARTIADGPFIEISATAPAPEQAIAGATSFARTFAADTRASFGSIIERRAAGLRARLRELAGEVEQLEQVIDGGSLEGAAATEAQAQLTALLDEQATLSAQLQAITSASGSPNFVDVFDEPAEATEDGAAVAVNGMLGLTGGLVLGSLLALVLSAAGGSRRIDGPALERRSGLSIVADMTAADGDDQMRVLAATITRPGGPATTIAVVSPEDGGGGAVARSLAEARAAMGDEVVLVEHSQGRTGTRGSRHDPESLHSPGAVAQALVASQKTPRLKTLRIDLAGSSGSARDSDDWDPFMRALEENANVVFFDASNLFQSRDAQSIAETSTESLLAVNTLHTSGAAAEASARLLRGLGAQVRGIVLVGDNPNATRLGRSSARVREMQREDTGTGARQVGGSDG